MNEYEWKDFFFLKKEDNQCYFTLMSGMLTDPSEPVSGRG